MRRRSRHPFEARPRVNTARGRQSKQPLGGARQLDTSTGRGSLTGPPCELLSERPNLVAVPRPRLRTKCSSPNPTGLSELVVHQEAITSMRLIASTEAWRGEVPNESCGRKLRSRMESHRRDATHRRANAAQHASRWTASSLESNRIEHAAIVCSMSRELARSSSVDPGRRTIQTRHAMRPTHSDTRQGHANRFTTDELAHRNLFRRNARGHSAHGRAQRA